MKTIDIILAMVFVCIGSSFFYVTYIIRDIKINENNADEEEKNIFGGSTGSVLTDLILFVLFWIASKLPLPLAQLYFAIIGSFFLWLGYQVYAS